jgi:hypothetical protein
MSVRRMFASTRASPGSDFLRETECRSRYQQAAGGLDRHRDRVLLGVAVLGEQV